MSVESYYGFEKSKTKTFSKVWKVKDGRALRDYESHQNLRKAIYDNPRPHFWT